MSDLSVSQNVQSTQPKKNYAAKGAAIGVGIYTALNGALVGVQAVDICKKHGKDAFVSSFKQTINNAGGKGKFAASVAGTIAAFALIGAGIGKIVEHFKNKNSEQA